MIALSVLAALIYVGAVWSWAPLTAVCLAWLMAWMAQKDVTT